MFQSISALARLLGLITVFLLFNSCATVPTTATRNPRGRILVCDARDATPAEMVLALAWQERMNRERPRAFLVRRDADFFWLDEVLHRLGEKARATVVPLDSIAEEAILPATGNYLSPASIETAQKDPNDAFLKSFQRRVPFAESLRSVAMPKARYVAWIWTESGSAPLQTGALARLLREPPGEIRAGLVVNASHVLERPLLADVLARRVLLQQDFSLIGAAENLEAIHTLPFAETGILAALVDPGQEKTSTLVDAASPAVTPRHFIGPPIVITDQALGEAATLLRTEGLQRKFVWCLADIGRLSPDFPARLARQLDNSWRFVTPAELLHAAARPEILEDRPPATRPDPFRVRLFDSIDPMLPLGVGIRWSGEGRLSWCDLRYWLDNSPPFVVPMRQREDWHIGFIPPIVNDSELRYQFMGTDESGQIHLSPTRSFHAAREDADQDGLSDIGEYLASTHRRRPDTDHDGIPDGKDPDPLRPTDETFLSQTLTDLRQAVRGSAEIRDGCMVIEATSVIVSVIRINAPGSAEGYRIRLRDCRGNYRVILAGDALPAAEVLHGRRRSDINNPFVYGTRQELIPAEYAIQESFEVRIEHDPQGLEKIGTIGGIDILMPEKKNSRDQ